MTDFQNSDAAHYGAASSTDDGRAVVPGSQATPATSQRIYLCASERAAKAARSIDLKVFLARDGQYGPDDTRLRELAGKEVVILFDGKNARPDYANLVLQMLAELPTPPIVRILEPLPGWAKDDLEDWISVRHGEAAEPEELRRQIEALADRSPAIRPRPPYGPVLICMEDVEPREVSWLWPQRIALGRISLLVGMPGTGKSFLTCDMAARVSTGTPWPDGSDCPRGSVILISAEDDPHDTIRPRLDAHYADVSRVHLLTTVRRRGKQGEAMFTLADVDMLEESLQRLPDCKLIVVDPIGSFLKAGTDAHRDNEVRAVLGPINRLAEKHGVAVVMIAHRRKAAANVADDTALGSRAFTGIARSIYHLTKDQNDKCRRLLLPGKSNIAAEQPGLAFSIIDGPPRVCWEAEPVAMNADEALSLENDEPLGESAVDEATAWLLRELEAGPRPATELKTQAEREDIAIRTLERARVKLGVTTRPSGFRGPWLWQLPDDGRVRQDTTEVANDQTLAQTGGCGVLCAKPELRVVDSDAQHDSSSQPMASASCAA